MTDFYLVFGSTKRPVGFMGEQALDWGQPPIGVYSAESAEEACQSAAKDNGTMATYAAVPCVPWGVDLYDAPAKQLGRTGNTQDRLAEVLERMEDDHKRRLAELSAGLPAEAENSEEH